MSNPVALLVAAVKADTTIDWTMPASDLHDIVDGVAAEYGIYDFVAVDEACDQLIEDGMLQDAAPTSDLDE